MRWLVRLGVAVGGLVLLSDLLGRAAGWGALGAGDGKSRRVAITFDDGPSDRTPELLKVLDAHGVKATFFVTAPACQAHPTQLQAIREAGHQLEAHGRWHTHALLLAPWREWAQIAWHPRALEPGLHLYRPPYGGHSPLTRLIARLTHREIALWDTESRDWTAADASVLARQILARTHPGSVILLHDGPEVTPALLDKLLAGLKEGELGAVTLGELPMQRITLSAGLKRLRASYGG